MPDPDPNAAAEAEAKAKADADLKAAADAVADADAKAKADAAANANADIAAKLSPYDERLTQIVRDRKITPAARAIIEQKIVAGDVVSMVLDLMAAGALAGGRGRDGGGGSTGGGASDNPIADAMTRLFPAKT